MAKENAMTDEERFWWGKIITFVEKEVLEYDSNQHMQKNAVLRLRGLHTGKVMANNKTENNGEYPYEVMYFSLVLAQTKFAAALHNGKEFDSEDQKLAYYVAIARNQLNDVYKNWKSKKHQMDILRVISPPKRHNGASYIPRDRKKHYNNTDKMW